MLASILRAFLFRRLFQRLLGGGGGRRGYGSGARYGSRYPSRYGSGRRSRGGSSFGFRPFPTYSTRTRRGSRVSVTGCCLPIPLGLFALPVIARTLLARRR